ncbi:MAG: ROK family protein [Bacteroidales bacterium]
MNIISNPRNIFLGVDVGGTKIDICTFNPEYKLLSQVQLPTADFVNKEMSFIKVLKKCITQYVDHTTGKIGISFKAVINKGVVVRSSLLGNKTDYQLAKEFSADFNMPVKVVNDVYAMAIAESVKGHGKGVKSFTLIGMGTGIRLAHMEDGKLITGFAGLAGEISQLNISIELGLENRTYNILSGKGLTNLYTVLSGRNKTADEIFATVKEDAIAQKTVDIFIQHLANLMVEISVFYNPEIIVINGGLKNSSQIFLPKAIKIYNSKTPRLFKVRGIYISKLDHAACLGAVLL